MIGYLSGEVIDKSTASAIVMAGGVGYEVNLPTSTLAKLQTGEKADFYIYTQVREDILALYGFKAKDELNFFKLLLSVSGIGPKVALSILSASSVEKLKSSIAKGDPSLLSAVSGVGKKTAEKAVVELKGKLGGADLLGQIFNEETEEVISALTGLGFNQAEAAEAVSRLPEGMGSTQEQIKEALKIIGNRSTSSRQERA